MSVSVLGIVVACGSGEAHAPTLSEPDDWFYPIRHYQGAALLGAGKPGEAEAVYRADLERHPRNGWALYGVWKSLAAQKKPKVEVREAKVAFEEAWARADFPLTTTAP